MPNYGTRQSPWMGVADMGDTFSNFMLSMAQLKARQAEVEQAQSFRQAELDQRGQQFNREWDQKGQQFEREMDMKAPLIDAQTQNLLQEALMNKQKTATAEQVAGRSTDAGLAAFGQEMTQNPEYGPLKTSFLQNTPENRKMLMAAMLAQSLTANAATEPSAAAKLSSPIEANQNTTVYAPSSRVIGQGPTSPAHAGNDGLATLTSIFRGTGDLLGTLGKVDALDVPAYKSSPEMTETYNGASALNGLVLKLLTDELRKRGVDPAQAVANSDTNAPAKSKYKVLKVE